MDTPDPAPQLPKLPHDLDDSSALNRWCREWNAWIATEAAKQGSSWLNPITPETLREIVEEEKRLRADIARGTQQIELSVARRDLNALEARLRATDPEYEAKRTLLVPILQPVFKHIPPANWKPLFEQAYAALAVPVATPTDDQREIDRANSSLSALQTQLIINDPDFESKAALLSPIMQSVFKRLPSSKWLNAFEEAYASIRLPTPSANESQSNTAATDVPIQSTADSATSKLVPLIGGLDFLRIEAECHTHCTKDIEEWNRVYVEQEMTYRVLPELRQKAFDEGHTDQHYQRLVYTAWTITKALFYSLHCSARSPSGSKPKFFWLHQALNIEDLPALCLTDDRRRGYEILEADLATSAAYYLQHPEVRTNHLDWLYLDTVVFCALNKVAEEAFFRKMGAGFNWGAILARSYGYNYILLSALFRTFDFALTYLLGPTIAYWLGTHDHEVAAIWAIGLWAAAILLRLINPFRRRMQLKARTFLTHLLQLNRILADKTIPLRILRERIAAANADGIVLDGAVATIIDRMLARDQNALIHLV